MTGALRVTHFGNAPGEEGGISTVVANFASWSFCRTEIRTVATYDRDSRLRTWGRFLRAVVLLCLRRRRTTGVAHVHLSQRGSLVREGSLVVLARLRRVPAVATVHGSGVAGSSAPYRWVTRHTLRHARHVTVLSDEVARHLGRLGVDSVEVVPNGVPVQSREEPQPPREPLVVLAGELSRRKGVDVLLDAWPTVRAAVPGARLLLLGPRYDVDPERRDRAGTLGLEAPGAQPQGEVTRALARARVACLPSRNEAMPMFLLEAMAAGCGFVATPVGGVPGLVAPDPDDGAPGELVPVGDAEALADALVVALDPDVARRRGAAARRAARARFSSDAVGARMEQIWHRVAVGAGDGGGTPSR